MIARELAGVAPLGLGIVAQVLDHFVLLVHQRDARAQVRDHDVAVLEEVEVAGHVGAADEIDVLAVQREALDARVAAVGDLSTGVPSRRSTMMPCGQSSWPASLPLPPKVRMYSPLLLYWLM